MSHSQSPARRSAHPPAIRVMHWIGAVALICMVMSGWQIYNASPLFPFAFPGWITLGGWLGGAIAWHLAAMWLLAADGLCYLAYGLTSGHFRRKMLPVGPRSFGQDFMAALGFRLAHRLGHYNAVQRAFYLGVIAAVIVSVATGVSIWKPMQLAWLTDLFGGYDTARYVHFFAMSAIVAFLLVHVALVALYPRTLVSMTVGLPAEPGTEAKA